MQALVNRYHNFVLIGRRETPKVSSTFHLSPLLSLLSAWALLDLCVERERPSGKLQFYCVVEAEIRVGGC